MYETAHILENLKEAYGLHLLGVSQFGKQVPTLGSSTFLQTAWNETNLMHYLYSVYSVAIPLHVLGFLVAHHQEVTTYTYNTLLPPDDTKLASPKHVEVQCQNKLKINSASSWFQYIHISRCTVKKVNTFLSMHRLRTTQDWRRSIHIEMFGCKGHKYENNTMIDTYID
jgi:hypothetical protein